MSITGGMGCVFVGKWTMDHTAQRGKLAGAELQNMIEIPWALFWRSTQLE